MKNLLFTIAFGIAAFTASANNDGSGLNSTGSENINDLTEVIAQIEVNQTLIGDAVLIKQYTGRCLDGHRFSFIADNREDGQAYVNAYCRGRSEAN